MDREMTSNKFITINGTKYDAHTGLPVDQTPTQAAAPAPRPAASRHKTSAANIHHKTQKSTTLQRKSVAKLAPKKPVRQLDGIVRRKPGVVAQSPAISKFAPKPVVKPLPQADLPAQAHPVVSRAKHKQATVTKHQAAVKPAASPTAESEIAKAMAKEAPTRHRAKRTKSKSKPKFAKALNLSVASLAVIVLAGYFTYLSIPSISIRVAATQAGIDASYPNYQPSGYKLNGPIAYDNGQVSIKFVATTGSQAFTIDQQQTNWDSSALLENYVSKQAEDYVPHQKGGLTIYTFKNDAAWVNKGILYTVSGNTQLSNEQILRMATSM